MTQTAHNDVFPLTESAWTLFSEINCTFVVNRGYVQVIGTDGAAPDAADIGVVYRTGTGEEVSTDTLARFVGSGTADGLYAKSLSPDTEFFVSRAAVA